MQQRRGGQMVLQVLCSVAVGGAVLWWMYRGFDWGVVRSTVFGGMHWGWMALSLLPGITAQVFRGVRWRLSLAPLGERPRTSTCIHAVFLSYAASLIIPRIGEVARCGVLRRWEGTSFTKAVGTVVTERLVDSLLVLLVTAVTLVVQLRVFLHFFRQTGVSASALWTQFSTTGYVVTILLGVITLLFLCVLLRRFGHHAKVRAVVADLKAGVLSLAKVEHKGLFALYTLGIWVSYFLHFYLTFWAFPCTAHLSMAAALGAFVAGTIAVLVPTPNGMGPWHFAVKTLLVLYAVGAREAEVYVLIVHAVQTALVPLLGVFSLIALGLTRKMKSEE